MPYRHTKREALNQSRQLNQLTGYFALEVPATRAAKVVGINRHGAERVYQVIRRCLARECELHSPLGGEVEADESYFGGGRKGPRGRAAAGKVTDLAALMKKTVRKHQAVLD